MRMAPGATSASSSRTDESGAVVVLDARNGNAVWRTKTEGQIGAGAGSDGRLAVVLTRANELALRQPAPMEPVGRIGKETHPLLRRYRCPR